MCFQEEPYLPLPKQATVEKSRTCMTSILTVSSTVVWCGPLSGTGRSMSAYTHLPTGLGKLLHGSSLFLKKVYSCVWVSLPLFQATYKGWLDIIGAAVDSRKVSHVLECYAQTRGIVSAYTASNFSPQVLSCSSESELWCSHSLVKRTLMYSAVPDMPVVCRIQPFFCVAREDMKPFM